MTVEGEVGVVTGAGGGLGRATATLLASRGAQLVLVDRDGGAARATAAESTGHSIVVEAYISREADVAAYLAAGTKPSGASISTT